MYNRAMKKLFIKLLFIFLSINFLYAQNLEKVTLRLDWLHQFQFAGYYMAKEKGFFNEVGLDVDIKEFVYGINQVDEVINQDIDYGIGKSSLIIDKLNGKNIIALSAIYQTSPMILLTTNLSIKKPQDLYNKNVMLTSDARTAVAINSMITSKGLNLNDINFQEHSFNIDDLINGKTDAMGSYISNEPFILKNKNIKFNVLDPKDYGFDFYGGILFTSKYELDNHPQRVQNFQKAILKGWDYAFNNIEESVEIIMNKYNTQKKSYSALIYEANVLKKLSSIETNNLGDINYKKLEEIKKIYSLLGYTNINQELNNFIVFPKDVLLTKKEKEYLQENTITYLSMINPPYNNGLGNSSIETDYLNVIKDKINIDIKIKNEEFSSFFINEDINQIKASITNNDITRNDVLLTEAITTFDIAIATNLEESFISSTNMLKDKKIAIREDCIFLDELEKKYSDIIFIKTKSIKDGFKLLSKKKVNAVIDILPLLTYTIKTESIENVKISGITEFKYQFRYILNKENKILHSILNKTIERINEKTKDEINFKYIKLDYNINKENTLFYNIAIISVLLILGLIFLNIKLSKEMKKRKEIETALSKIAHTDELTGLNNRRKMIKILINNIFLSKRYSRPLSIIFFDIDNFKTINDIHGHSIGDEILKEVSTIINENIRVSDSFGRWGGEEFLIILPETSKDNAGRTAENLKEVICSTKFNSNISLTCSFGVSSLKEDDTKKSFIKRADEAMYFIKNNGKNGVKVD